MLQAGSADVVVAGGMESMTNAPHLTFVRKGVQLRRRARSTTTWRSTAWKTPTSAAKAMGVFAEECVAKYKLHAARRMDQFAIASTAAREAGQRGRQLRLGDGAR